MPALNTEAPSGPTDFMATLKNITPDKVRSMVTSAVQSLSKTYLAIEELRDEDVTVANTVMEMIYGENEVSSSTGLVQFLQHASTEVGVRQASIEAEQTLKQFTIEMGYKVGVFRKFKLIQEHFGGTLQPELRRYLDNKILSGKQKGLHLSAEVQTKVRNKATQIANLEVAFSHNIGEDETTLVFTEEELDGVPKDFLESLPKDEAGNCILNLKFPNYSNIMIYCNRFRSRKRFETCFHSRCMEKNMVILQDVLTLRQEMAELTGYANFTESELEKRMSKDLPSISRFLRRLEREFKKIHKKEFRQLVELKKKECKAQGLEFAGKLHLCDYSYFANELTKRDYQLDKMVLAEYFPMRAVLEGTLAVYGRFLSMNFTHLKDAEVWHESVLMYKATDAKDNRLMGYFYLDLFPRPGKFTHAALKPVQPSCVLRDGTQQVSICAMLANFSAPTAPGAQALLQHSEVATFLHEFGHLVHYLCGTAISSTLSDYNTEVDFLELPSQAFENLAWEPEILAKLSGHYITGAPIPPALMGSLLRSRLANVGAYNLRQIAFALYDLTVHNGHNGTDLLETYDRIYKEVTGAEPTPGTAFPACFDHIVHLGYAAGYYSYLLSDVFAADVYLNTIKGRMSDPEIGMKYRTQLLEPGGSQDPNVLLRKYLGRDPNLDAYFKLKNISVGVEA